MSKFRKLDSERPKIRRRPPKRYHPLLEKEILVGNVIRKTLPKPVQHFVQLVLGLLIYMVYRKHRNLRYR